ncbi:unnamed protein product [Paramecium octaurelia]|uniref:Uncharacterized protein n=1 Tax=Paramecium octaurelia TaxID=43137 RepID=A0A8S1T7J3_PAROT|nr:unnamed protein product [Paramecium octaurelia]
MISNWKMIQLHKIQNMVQKFYKRCNWALSQSSNLWLQLQAQDQNVQLNYNQKLDKHFIEINLKKHGVYYNGHVKFYQNVWKIYLIQSQRCRYVQRSCCKLSIVVLEGTSNKLLEGFKGRWYLTDVKNFFGIWSWGPLPLDQIL